MFCTFDILEKLAEDVSWCLRVLTDDLDEVGEHHAGVQVRPQVGHQPVGLPLPQLGVHPGHVRLPVGQDAPALG